MEKSTLRGKFLEKGIQLIITEKAKQMLQIYMQQRSGTLLRIYIKCFR